MSAIASGWMTGFFLYDIAEAIDLHAVDRLIGPTTSTRVAAKPPAPPYIQYLHPPVSIEGAAVGVAHVDGWQVRVKAFDYGVLSIALTRAGGARKRACEPAL